jgi:uncharacterized protein (TIGR02996 family)
MGEEHALIRAVCSYPEDDTPRLVYADWLDEHGQTERAEYLRLAVGWAREVGLNPNPYAWEHLPRLRELSHHPALRPPPAWDGPGLGHPLPWLPTEVQFNSWSEFENHAAARFVLAHACWRVMFDDRRKRRWDPGYVRRLVTNSQMIRVLDLELRSIRVEAEGARAIADSPQVANLARLDLGLCQVDDAGAEALAGSPNLAGLVYLNLFHNPLSETSSRRLRERFGPAVRL